MLVSFRIALGGLAALWSLRGLLILPPAGTPRLVLGFVAGLAILGAVLLAVGREERAAAWMVAAAAAIHVLLNAGRAEPPSELLVVFAVIVATTVGRNQERVTLLRILVTTVYLFTALAKLNPSFLAGEQIEMILATRPQLTWVTEFVAGGVATSLAVLTIVVEFSLAIGLWLARTRRTAAAVGVVTHLLFTLAVGRGAAGVVYLVVLNFGLVAAYPAFFAPGLAPRRLSRRAHMAGPAVPG